MRDSAIAVFLCLAVPFTFFATETERLGRRVRLHVPANRWLALLAAPLLPGGGRGLLLLLLLGPLLALAGIVFYVAATPLASFFLGGRSTEVVPLAARLLRIVAYAMLPLAVTMVLIGALRGAGDTRWPLVLNLIGIVFLRVPLAILLAHDAVRLPILEITLPGAGLGVVGAWYGAVIDIVARCFLMIARFRQDAWQRIEV